MSINKQTLLLILVLLLVFAASAVALPSEGGGMKWRHRMGNKEKGMRGWGRLGDKFGQYLGLNKEQEENLLKQKQKMEQAGLEDRQKVEKIELKVRNEMIKENPDREKIKSYVKEIGTIRSRSHIRKMDFILDIYSQLTPEQKEKFRKLHEMNMLRKDGRKE